MVHSEGACSHTPNPGDSKNAWSDVGVGGPPDPEFEVQKTRVFAGSQIVMGVMCKLVF